MQDSVPFLSWKRSRYFGFGNYVFQKIAIESKEHCGYNMELENASYNLKFPQKHY